ncbi:hypothetical protein NUW58_g6448 [Xylaria curta]|uniref:Uncharacterized protein n=1 Tax=Xylaria curta TaxID=42375 RepID=A0ACC1NVF3_9PEZI|nr:hypothetical protein NUW58_g6448 [Xylaria curta]
MRAVNKSATRSCFALMGDASRLLLFLGIVTAQLWVAASCCELLWAAFVRRGMPTRLSELPPSTNLLGRKVLILAGTSSVGIVTGVHATKSPTITDHYRQPSWRIPNLPTTARGRGSGKGSGRAAAEQRQSSGRGAAE